MTTTPLESALAAMAAQPSDPLIAAKCRGLITGYDSKWRDVEWETISVEESYRLPLVNPETGRTSRTFTHAGKFDGMVRYVPSGKTYLLEHKTSSEDIADPNSTFWRRMPIESQVSHYCLANLQLGVELSGTVYDVIKKPGIRPKAVEGAEFRNLVQNGTYFGFPVPDKARRMLKREDEELYSLRLSRECLDNPDKYFQRRTVPRLNSEVAEYANELWDIGQEILATRNSGRTFRNPAACMTWNTPCEYLDLCNGTDSLESDKWERVSTVHEELPIIQGDGKDVLTNSRIRCYQTCRRKHELRYELGVRRRDDEEREALVFGSLLHEGLAAWWSCFKKGNSNDIDSNAASEVARSAEELARTSQE